MEVKEQIENVAKLIHPEAFIAGGAARYLYNAEEIPSDIDVFFRHAGDKNYGIVMSRLREAGYSNTVSLRNSTIWVKSSEGFVSDWLKVQLVIPREDEWMISGGTPVSVIENFGFTCEQFYAEWSLTTDKVELGYSKAATQAVINKQLVITKGRYLPLSYLWRINKYGKKGYSIGSKELLKLVKAWEEYDPQRKAMAEKDVTEGQESFGLEIDVN